MRNVGLLLIFVGAWGAQATASKSTEPTVIGVAYLLERSGQTLPLPQETWKAGKAGIEIAGERSSFRIADKKPEFVFIVTNPEDVTLYRCIQDKKMRAYKAAEISVLRGKNKSVPGVPFDITKFRTSSYHLTSRSPLEPGEYVMTLAGFKTFTFGIDP